MRLLRIILAGLILSLGVPGAPALAACTDDLKQVKEDYNRLRDTRKRDLMKRQISKADQALKQKNESTCKRAVAEANKILRQRP